MVNVKQKSNKQLSRKLKTFKASEKETQFVAIIIMRQIKIKQQATNETKRNTGDDGCGKIGQFNRSRARDI